MMNITPVYSIDLNKMEVLVPIQDFGRSLWSRDMTFFGPFFLVRYHRSLVDLREISRFLIAVYVDTGSGPVIKRTVAIPAVH